MNGNLIEIKGFITKHVLAKLKAVNEPIKILTYEDLQEYMNYVDVAYNKVHSKKGNNYYTLYDSHKPKKEYVCEYCGKHFESEIIRKPNKHIFCSRSCSGLYQCEHRSVYRTKNKKHILPNRF